MKILKQKLVYLIILALTIFPHSIFAISSGVIPYGDSATNNWSLLASSTGGSLLQMSLTNGFPVWTSTSTIFSAGWLGFGTSSPIGRFHFSNGTGSTTIYVGGQVSTARTQFDIRNTTGTEECMFVVGTTLVITATKCNP